MRLPKLADGDGMSAPAGCRLIGRWRIIEADLWDRAYLDLDGPAMITIGAGNRGENRPSALCRRPSTSATAPQWSSSHGPASTKMDKVTGDGHAELLDDGAIEITFAYHNGDEAIQGQAGYSFNTLLVPLRKSAATPKALRHRQPSSSRPQRIHRRRVIRSVQLRAVHPALVVDRAGSSGTSTSAASACKAPDTCSSVERSIFEKRLWMCHVDGIVPQVTANRF